MNAVLNFLKVTLIGGLLVLLPIWLAVVVLLKVFNGAMALVRPLANMFPQTLVHQDAAAVIILILISFLVGLAIRTKTGIRLREWLTSHLFEHLPGFSLWRGVARQLAGDRKEQSFPSGID